MGTRSGDDEALEIGPKIRHVVRVGKNWSRGLTKATDARVARAAAAHVGLRYVARSPETDKRRKSRPRGILEWNRFTAYGLGLAATDGNLGRDGRYVQVGALDLELVANFLRCFGRDDAYISVEDGPYYRSQLSDRVLHEFLTAAGLTPCKSLTLAGLVFPPSLFWDVVRGLIDGDGSIKSYVHNPIRRTYPGYSYERLEVHFHTASFVHAQWIHAELKARGLRSALLVSVRRTPKQYAGHVMYKVKLGKHASIALLARIYAEADTPRLTRKWMIWECFRSRYSDDSAGRLVRKAGAAGRSYAAVSKTAGPKAHVGSNPTSGTESAALQ